jgi:hypothetical protein
MFKNSLCRDGFGGRDPDYPSARPPFRVKYSKPPLAWLSRIALNDGILSIFEYYKLKTVFQP